MTQFNNDKKNSIELILHLFDVYVKEVLNLFSLYQIDKCHFTSKTDLLSVVPSVAQST